MDLSSARHELLGVAPAGFVAERDRLAKELVAAGQKKEAAELKKLRKPAATLWALNQVARRDASLLDALFATGERMVAVHQTLARGEAGADFRETSADYRRAIGAVVAAATDTLATAGLASDAATTRRLERTLEALAVAAPELRAAARAGELEEELDRADAFDTTRFEVAPGLAPRAPAIAAAGPRAAAAPPPRPAAAPAPARPAAAAPRATPADDDTRRQAERRRQAEARRAAALDAAKAAERAAKAAERAAQDERSARTRFEAAQRALHEAEAACDAARQRTEQARTDLAAREASHAEAERSARALADASARASRAAAENDET